VIFAPFKSATNPERENTTITILKMSWSCFPVCSFSSHNLFDGVDRTPTVTNSTQFNIMNGVIVVFGDHQGIPPKAIEVTTANAATMVMDEGRRSRGIASNLKPNRMSAMGGKRT
jgi:hypothetical protein